MSRSPWIEGPGWDLNDGVRHGSPELSTGHNSFREAPLPCRPCGSQRGDVHRHGTVFEELAVEVMAELPTSEARREVLNLIELARADPWAWPDVRDAGSVEEIREAFGARFSTCPMPGPSRYARSGGPADGAFEDSAVFPSAESSHQGHSTAASREEVH